MLHEYGGGASTQAISDVFAVPLAQAFALYAAIAARYDMQPAGPTFRDREILAALHTANLRQ